MIALERKRLPFALGYSLKKYHSNAMQVIWILFLAEGAPHAKPTHPCWSKYSE